MVEFRIKTLIADGKSFNFKRGFLYHHDEQDSHSWEVELLGSTSDRLIQKELKDENINLQITTEDDEVISGEAIINNVNEGPEGTNVLFNGTGKLLKE